MVIWSFDPGETTGYSIWKVTEGQARLVEMGQLSFNELVQQLNVYSKPVDHVVVEDFRLFAKRAARQSGSRMPAPKAIGVIHAFVAKKEAQLHLQPANIKPIALKWTQIHMPSQHSKTHEWDAYLHAAYWLINKGWLKTALQIDMELKDA
jgi:hypothetical protein